MAQRRLVCGQSDGSKNISSDVRPKKMTPTASKWLLLLLLAAKMGHAELRFRENRRFKVVQFADLHFGENAWSTWGPEQDVKSLGVMDSILTEEQPDFIVFSGDQLTANNIGFQEKNATKYWNRVVSVAKAHGIPWAQVLGNHDDAPFEPHAHPEYHTSREELLRYDQTFDLSYTQCLFGGSNYVLYIKSPIGTHDWASLLMLDSGGGTRPGTIRVACSNTGEG